MAKGGNFELKIAKILSLWFSEGERDDLVCRTDSSGGRATVRSKKGKETNIFLYGDLKHSDDLAMPMFKKWSIECKTGYAKKNKKSITKWDILDLIDSTQKETVFEMMWNQCKNDAKLSKRKPVLIFGRNLRSPCIAIDIDYFNSLPYAHLIGVKIIDVSFNDDRVIVFNLSTFLRLYTAKNTFKGERK